MAKATVGIQPLLQLKNLQGVPLTHEEILPNEAGVMEKKIVPLTLGAAIIGALLGDYPDEMKTITSLEKARRFFTANKIQTHMDAFEVDKGDVILKQAEVISIKLLAGKAYTPLVCGLIWQAIDPDFELIGEGND